MKTIDELFFDITIYDLDAPDATLIADYYDCANGCGAKGGMRFPKTMWGVNIESTCYIHDIRWKLANSMDDLVRANEEFDNNLKKICDAESNRFTRWFRRMRIAKYVSAVELIGTPEYAKLRGFLHG